MDGKRIASFHPFSYTGSRTKPLGAGKERFYALTQVGGARKHRREITPPFCLNELGAN
jgi:hypothetical protein